MPYKHNAPFRYDVVGSFLRPDVLKQARADHAAGIIDDAQLKTVENEAIRDLARLYERMVMRKHTNGGYVHVLDELWKVCEQFNANFIIMYQHVCCKTMAGLQGLFDEQARERGLHLIWVEHDLMDPRTVSRRDMRAKVTNYMRAIIQAEPTDESLIEFEDDITW